MLNTLNHCDCQLRSFALISALQVHTGSAHPMFLPIFHDNCAH